MEKGRGKGTDTSTRDNVFTRKEYIERDAVKSAIYEIMDKYDPYDRCDRKAVIALQRADDAIDLIPAADVVARDCYDRLLSENDELRKVRPVRHGRWEWDGGEDMHYNHVWQFSACSCWGAVHHERCNI